MAMGRKYQFEHCECLGSTRRFNIVIPSGIFPVDESRARVRIILGFRVREVDKSAFEQLKSERKVIPV
jgi:hypothetical protein